MPEAALGLGGNMGDPVALFATTLQSLAMHPRIKLLARSSVYHTAPWGKTDQPDFLNMAVLIETGLSAEDLLSFGLLIETAAGRRRAEKWAPRTLDIDLLTFGQQTIATAALQIPHPRIVERAFVLVPLAEIAPGLLIAGRTVADLRDAVDTSPVARDDIATARLAALVDGRPPR